MSDLVILIVGFLIVNILSLIIAARVQKHLNAFYALFTHIFVILVAVYYCIDLLLLRRFLFHDPYFYLWISIIVTQIIFIVIARTKKNHRAQATSE